MQLMPPLVYYLEQLETVASDDDASKTLKSSCGEDGQMDSSLPEAAGNHDDTARRAVDIGREVVLAWATAAVFVCEQCCAPTVSNQTTFAREVVRVAYE